jgi:hypothetical protein
MQIDSRTGFPESFLGQADVARTVFDQKNVHDVIISFGCHKVS